VLHRNISVEQPNDKNNPKANEVKDTKCLGVSVNTATIVAMIRYNILAIVFITVIWKVSMMQSDKLC